MTDKQRKWRSPKQWYEEEYAPKNQWDHAYRQGGIQGMALVLLGSSFLIRYGTLDRWALPTLRDVLISIPFMLIGAAILLRYRSADYKRKEARRWGWHDPVIEQLPAEEGTGYRATCKCGWRGGVWESEMEAFLEHNRHALAEDDRRQAAIRKASRQTPSRDSARRLSGSATEEKLFWREQIGPYWWPFKSGKTKERQLHSEEVFEISSAAGTSYRSACRCGWQGPVREEMVDVFGDHTDHVIADGYKREENSRKGDA